MTLCNFGTLPISLSLADISPLPALPTVPTLPSVAPLSLWCPADLF